MEIRSFVAVTLPEVALFRGLPRVCVFAFGQNLAGPGRKGRRKSSATCVS